VKALWFLVVFLAVTVTVTVAALTAFFIFWSFVPAQPGTATALAMLFLVAPGVGIASGLAVAVRAVRPQRSPATSRWPFALLAALTGGLAGFGGCMAMMDLTYTNRFSDPASAPSWLPMAPPVAGVIMAALAALLVLLFSRRSLTAT
jgi:hypothetical protein